VQQKENSMTASTAWKGNPYVIGTPIDDKRMFFGRETLLQFIDDNLRQGARVILLYGQRRIGKSSVLAQIPNFIESDQFYFVSFDLQNQSRRLLGEVLHSLANAIVEHLEDDYEIPLNTIALPLEIEFIHDPDRFSYQFLPEVFQQIGEQNLVLLLDEFDVLSNYSSESAIEHFFPYLQSIISIHEKLFIIPAIGRRPEDLQNLISLFKGAPAQEVWLLDEHSARSLITKPSEGILHFKPDAIQTILDLTSGHPYFTQVVCFSLFGQARSQAQWMVTRAEVEQVVNKAIESSRPGLTWFRDSLPITERVIFSAVAEAQQRVQENSGASLQSPLALLGDYGIIQTASLARAGNRLVEWGFLNVLTPATPGSSKFPLYTVKVELVRRWLVEAYPLYKEAWELEKLIPEAQRLYEVASEQYRSGQIQEALHSYEQVLEINPNHFTAVFEAADVYLEWGEFAKAVKLYQRAFKLDALRVQDGLVQSLLDYGRDLIQQGMVDRAREQFTEVLDIEPENPIARKQLEQVEAQIGRRYLSAPNPFTVGQLMPPSRFIGRTAELATAFDQLSSYGHLNVWGGPGMGKTAFLQQLSSPDFWQQHGFDPSPLVVILVSCLSVTPPFTAANFWFEVLSLLHDELDDLPDVQSEVNDLLSQEKFSIRSIRQILRRLGKHNKWLILLIDDYEEAMQPHEQYQDGEIELFLTEQRSLAYSSTQRQQISMVVATSRPLGELNFPTKPDRSPWFNHYLFLPLRSLSRTEAEALLSPISMPPALQETVWETAGGNPTLLQLAGSLLYTELRSGRLLETDEFCQSFLNQAEPYFQHVWTKLNDIEQILLILIALRNLVNRSQKREEMNLGEIDRLLNQRERELMHLMYWGILAKHPHSSEMNYTFSSSLMEWWLLKQLQENNSESSSYRSSVLSSLTNYEQKQYGSDILTHILHLVWQHASLNLSISDWLNQRRALS
jgi:tetratricopeptide (TPR) repeat protein